MRSFFLLILGACSLGVSACRRYAPVERHFLRVPAAYAAELSGIDREKWLKQTRKRSEAGPQVPGYLKLSAAARPVNLAPLDGEVRFFPKEEGSRQGMVALHWQKPGEHPEGAADALWLLKTDGGRYVAQPLTRWVPPSSSARRYSLTEEPEGLVIYHRAGAAWRKTAVLRWRAGTWQVK